jgi:hypothetical protein
MRKTKDTACKKIRRVTKYVVDGDSWDLLLLKIQINSWVNLHQLGRICRGKPPNEMQQ